MKSKYVKVIVITIFLILLFYGGLYIAGINSEPYKVASNYLNENKYLSETFGDTSSTYLDLVGFNISHKGASGIANFKIHINGKKASGVAYLDLVYHHGQWNIKSGTIYANERIILEL